jgi:hypothetical protein
MTAMTGDTIDAFAAPALGVAGAPTVNQVLARHRAIRADRRIPSRDF